MHLINIDTLQLERFDVNPPSYAILSHRWRDGEVSFGEFADLNKRRRKAGFTKILDTCAQARRDNLAYVWVDTCCIDKSSSAELSEAINSMFAWYQGAAVCYAFLDDVFANAQDADGAMLGPSQWSETPCDNMAKSEWFERGWTLQELIAPRTLDFFCRPKSLHETGWCYLGNRARLSYFIMHTTGIPAALLWGNTRLSEFSVSKRMSWAAKRKTTRHEDTAYCLMGLFGVNMPLLYGEGSKAFFRLQEEIIRTIDDDTILAWTEPQSSGFDGLRGIFAPSPSCFASTPHLAPIPSFEPDSHFVNTSKGLRTSETICPTREMLDELDIGHRDQSYVLLPLNCCSHAEVYDGKRTGILLRWQDDRTYLRVPSKRLFHLESEQVSRDSTVFIGKHDMPDCLGSYLGYSSRLRFNFQFPDKGVTFLRKISPVEGDYYPSRYTFHVDGASEVPRKLAFVFHLGDFSRLLLVAMKLDEEPEASGKEEIKYTMVTDVLPVESTKSDYKKCIVKARDQWLSKIDDTVHHFKAEVERLSRSGTQDQVPSIKPGPVGALFTHDVKVRSADGLTTMKLRVSLVKDAIFLSPTYILRLSFVGSRVPSV